MGKQLEKRLIQNLERERAANRAKDEFLAVLSHELRTPLNPVLLLASDNANNRRLPQNVRGDFKTICQNLEVEIRLIDDLLDLVRTKRGKVTLEPRLVDAHAVLANAISIVENEIARKQILLKLRFQAANYQIYADTVRLRQIFWNVMKNAVKFTPKAGEITVTTETMGSQMIIRITDTGIGMTPYELKNIFREFSQGSHGLGGLGLGLSISKRLVKLHSGSISAASLGKNKGATFSIRFPVIK
jgi:signal transduction histidine kinase